MPLESIGEFGRGDIRHDREWIICQHEMAITFLLHVCGLPPDGYELDIMWHEHELGDYPTIGIAWDEPNGPCEPPRDYMSKCEVALTALENAIAWDKLRPDDIRARFPTQEVREDDDEGQE